METAIVGIYGALPAYQALSYCHTPCPPKATEAQRGATLLGGGRGHRPDFGLGFLSFGAIHVLSWIILSWGGMGEGGYPVQCRVISSPALPSSMFPHLQQPKMSSDTTECPLGWGYRITPSGEPLL